MVIALLYTQLYLSHAKKGLSILRIIKKHSPWVFFCCFIMFRVEDNVLKPLIHMEFIMVCLDIILLPNI